MKITLKYGKGYSGKLSHRPYVARITGSDKRYGLCREFLEPESVEREHFNQSRTMVDYVFDLSHGLYEFSEAGEKRIRMIAGHKIKGEAAFALPDDRIKKMISLMDGGKTFNEARKETKS